MTRGVVRHQSLPTTKKQRIHATPQVKAVDTNNKKKKRRAKARLFLVCTNLIFI
jgi:hypothetical protein